MSRDLSSANATAVAAAHVRMLIFAKIELDSGTLYLHNSIGTITWDSQDWLGVGDFGGVQAWEEGSDISPYGFYAILSLIDSGLAASALSEDISGRDITVYVGTLDDDGALNSDPDVVLAGQVDVPQIVAGAENAIRLSCESHIARVSRPSGLVYSHATQQQLFAGDMGLEYAEKMVEADIRWGGRSNDFRAGNGINAGVGAINIGNVGLGIGPRFDF